MIKIHQKDYQEKLISDPRPESVMHYPKFKKDTVKLIDRKCHKT